MPCEKIFFRGVAERAKIRRNMAEFELEPLAGALWMPVYTQPLHEFRLRDFLTNHNIVCYLPTVPEWKIRHIKSKKGTYEYRKVVERPMFRGYLFARLRQEDKLVCWQSRSVISFLEVSEPEQNSFLKELRAVRMMEMLAREQPLEYGSEVHEGDKFIIESGAFEGVEGRLLKKNRQFLWTVEIECLNRSISVEIDPAKLKMRKLPSS